MQEELTDSNDDDENISSIFETATAKIERISCYDSRYRVLPVSKLGKVCKMSEDDSKYKQYFEWARNELNNSQSGR